MKRQLEYIEKDQLKEVVNVGSGNASSAFSKMIDKRVEVKSPDVIIDELEKISSYLGDSTEIVTTVLLKMTGSIPGVVFLMFSSKSVLSLAEILTKNHKDNVRFLDDMDYSAIQEVGNILTGNSITALSKFLNTSIIQSIPEVVTDMRGAVVNSIISEVGEESESVLVFKTDFSVPESDIYSRLFFIFDPISTDKILKKTKAKLKE